MSREVTLTLTCLKSCDQGRDWNRFVGRPGNRGDIGSFLEQADGQIDAPLFEVNLADGTEKISNDDVLRGAVCRDAFEWVVRATRPAQDEKADGFPVVHSSHLFQHSRPQNAISRQFNVFVHMLTARRV